MEAEETQDTLKCVRTLEVSMMELSLKMLEEIDFEKRISDIQEARSFGKRWTETSS